MQFTIDYKEIEALILAKTGLLLKLSTSDYVLKLQPRNMGFIHNRVKVRIQVDESYNVPNRVKLHVSAGIFSRLVVPKVMALLDFMPEGSVARQNDGTIYVMFDKIPMLQTFCSYCQINKISFCNALECVVADAVFSKDSGINVDDIPPVEDSWSESTSLKDREIGNTISSIARAIFESDRMDEIVQEVKKEKVKDNADNDEEITNEDLKNATLSFLKRKWESIKADTESSTEDNTSSDSNADATEK